MFQVIAGRPKSAFRLVFVVTVEVQDGFVISMEEEKREAVEEEDQDPFCDGRQQLDDRLSNPLFIFLAMLMIHSASMLRPFVPINPVNTFLHSRVQFRKSQLSI